MESSAIPEKQFIADCETQRLEFEKREKTGTNQFLYIRALRTVLGREAQALWQILMKKAPPLPAGHPDGEQRVDEIGLRKESK